MFFRGKTAGAVLAAMAAVGLTTAAALPASASTTNYFEILVQVSTNAPAMCLQPADPAGGAGTAIVQQSCSVGSQAQNWAPVNTTGTTYEFLNQASGMCLDVRGGAARNTPIEQWPCGNISNEHWTWPHSFPDAFWPLTSQVAGSSGFCLDVPGASTQAGLGVQLYTCNGTAAQAWAIAGPVS
jgi:Ricin-type beta-trefoil lectin domain-like